MNRLYEYILGGDGKKSIYGREIQWVVVVVRVCGGCLKTSLGQTNCQLWTGGAVCGPPTRVIHLFPYPGGFFFFFVFL